MGSYEASNYEQLVKALREAPSDWYDADLHYNAAAAIDALQAEVKRLNMRCADCEYASKPWPELEPKRGEWEVKGANRIDCSVCGHSICFASVLSKGSLTGYNYCPNCGADMRKMEVQDDKTGV